MAQRTVEASLAPRATCDPATAATRSLLGYGVLAGPVYVAVSLVQATTRDGFDLSRHEWSLLANGRLGWIQIANLMLTGAMCVAFAIGARRALAPGSGRAATWGPRLIGAYGACLVAAGALRADPALGFPPGTPDGGTGASWHGVLHFVSAGIGFVCLIVACFAFARRFEAAGARRLAAFSAVTAAAFLAGFMGVASGARGVAANLTFTAAIVLVWAWLTTLALHLYRTID